MLQLKKKCIQSSEKYGERLCSYKPDDLLSFALVSKVCICGLLLTVITAAIYSLSIKSTQTLEEWS